MKKLLTLLLILGACTTYAQNTKLNNSEEIIVAAQGQLDNYFKGADFAKYCKKTSAKAGKYVFQISMLDKGKVESVRLLENIDGDIQTQNNLLHLIRSLKIKIKTPKNKRYAFKHTVEVN